MTAEDHRWNLRELGEQDPERAPDLAAAEVAAADPAPGEPSPAAAVHEDLASLRAQRDDLQDRLLRLAAEFDNYRKRSAREWREHKDRATAEVLREILEFADNLERALAAPPEEALTLHAGVRLILQQLQAKLQRFGVEAFGAEGEVFDPNRHEAVLMVEAAGVESSHIVGVVQRGYTQHGEVLRPARVTVAR